MESLRRHVLSNFAVLSVEPVGAVKKPTFNTDSVEVSDADEFRAAGMAGKALHMGPTLLTRSVEISDEDSLAALAQRGPTCLTEELETTDIDEFQMSDPSWLTHADGETSDPDEFLLSGPTNMTFTMEETDRDEFL